MKATKSIVIFSKELGKLEARVEKVRDRFPYKLTLIDRHGDDSPIVRVGDEEKLSRFIREAKAFLGIVEPPKLGTWEELTGTSDEEWKRLVEETRELEKRYQS